MFNLVILFTTGFTEIGNTKRQQILYELYELCESLSGSLW